MNIHRCPECGNAIYSETVSECTCASDDVFVKLCMVGGIPIVTGPFDSAIGAEAGFRPVMPGIVLRLELSPDGEPVAAEVIHFLKLEEC